MPKLYSYTLSEYRETLYNKITDTSAGMNNTAQLRGALREIQHMVKPSTVFVRGFLSAVFMQYKGY